MFYLFINNTQIGNSLSTINYKIFIKVSDFNMFKDYKKPQNKVLFNL